MKTSRDIASEHFSDKNYEIILGEDLRNTFILGVELLLDAHKDSLQSEMKEKINEIPDGIMSKDIKEGVISIVMKA